MIPVAEPSLEGNELKYATEAIKTGWVSSKGKYVSLFEKKFSKFCGVKYSLSCNNGTSALHLALLALGICPGDEVIIPAFTYIATANAITYVGATPIFIDSDRKTWNINPEKIEEKITEKTKAIIPVHLYGMPCEMDKIMKIAKKYNLYVIEDCAEAHGAKYKGEKVGSFGNIGCFSFFGNKIMTTGEGGMCITNNKKLKEKIENFKNQGVDKTKTYWHNTIGFNYRMTNIQAAIGLAQLERINFLLKRRKEIFKQYSNSLKKINAIELPPKINNIENTCWMYCILSNKKEKIRASLKKENIETRPLFPPITKMPPYYSKDSYPIAEELNLKGINLPSSANLTKKEIQKICDIIKKVVENEN